MFNPTEIREIMQLEITEKSTACKRSLHDDFGPDGWHIDHAEAWAIDNANALVDLPMPKLVRLT